MHIEHFVSTVVDTVPCLRVSQPHGLWHILYLLEITSWQCHQNTASNQFLSMEKLLLLTYN